MVQELLKNVTNDVLRHLSLSIVLLDEQSFGSSPNKDFSEVRKRNPYGSNGFCWPIHYKWFTGHPSRIPHPFA